MTAQGPAPIGTQTPGPDVALGALDLARPIVLPSDATVQTVAQAMVRAGRSAVVVGSWTVVTERDIARAVALGRSPGTPAAAVTGHDDLALRRDAPVTEALAVMTREGVREVVVIDDDSTIIGVIDLAAALEIVFGHGDVPPSLSALRVAIRAELRLD